MIPATMKEEIRQKVRELLALPDNIDDDEIDEIIDEEYTPTDYSRAPESEIGKNIHETLARLGKHKFTDIADDLKKHVQFRDMMKKRIRME